MSKQLTEKQQSELQRIRGNVDNCENIIMAFGESTYPVDVYEVIAKLAECNRELVDLLLEVLGE